MKSVSEWLEAHDDLLERLAAEHRMDPGLVRLLAALVITEHSDEEIYQEALALLVSQNGHRSPLAEAPHVLSEIRAVASADH